MIKKKLVITGGGTGGHVFPALSIATEMHSRGWEIRYVGTERGMEAKLVPEAGFPFFTVKTGAVKNQSLTKIFSTFFRLLGGFLWSLRFLTKEKPSAVLGVGGYVSFPVCFAAFVLGIPLFLQEQNSSVGIANRILGRLAKKVFLGFKEAESYFPKNRSQLTGNPLRSDFYSVSKEPYRSMGTSLLVLGGSQGSKAINDALLNSLALLFEKIPHLEIFHQTGQKDFESVKIQTAKYSQKQYTAVPFTSNILELYRKATLVIARSGALTVSELIQIGRPAIFIPYPRIGQNDQLTNAYMIERAGAGGVVEQGTGFNSRLEKKILETFTPSVLEGMHQNYEKLRSGSALIAIAEQLEQAT